MTPQARRRLGVRCLTVRHQRGRPLAGDKENAADLVGGVNVKHQDKDAAVLRTLLDMSTTAQIKDSLQARQRGAGPNRPVGRLHKTARRAGRLCRAQGAGHPEHPGRDRLHLQPDEEDRLRDPAYQDRLVNARCQPPASPRFAPKARPASAPHAERLIGA